MPRITAWRILRSGSATPLREVDRFASRAELDARDRALLRRIVGSEVRRRGTLRALLGHYARGKPSPDVATHVHIGLAQLFFLDRVPAHAAVSETVRATRDTLGAGRSRYVNALLRAVLRARRSGHCGDPRRDLVGREWHLDEPVFRDPRSHPALWAEDALSIPASLMKHWTRRFGAERASELAHTCLEEPRLSVRVVHGEREALAEELRSLELEPVPAGHPRVLLLSPGDVEGLVHSAPFEEGRVTVQGEAALGAAELVGAEDGERLLELGASPGGKTAVLAASGASVLALDVSHWRLARCAAALARLRLPGTVRCVVSDGDGALGEALFDGVLVDAPCSNTAVLGQRPGARWRFGPASLRALAGLQARLLDEAARHVRPGGRLVYSTCSLEPQENDQVVRAFLERHRRWSLVRELETLPGRSGPVDGGYAARLEW